METTRNMTDAPTLSDDEEDIPKGSAVPIPAGKAPAAMPTPPSDHEQEVPAEAVKAGTETNLPTMRLFIRNLAYDIRREELEACFAPYGDIEEVGSQNFSFLPITKMNT